MKKTTKLIGIILAVLTVFSLTLSAFAATITAEQAKAIALEHAGVNASEVTFLKAAIEFDDGIEVYDVEFYKGINEYDYEINAATGAIVSFDADAETVSPVEGVNITLDQAKAIAIERAGVSASEVTFTKTALSIDDGRPEYEIDFRVGYKATFEVEIDAGTGTVTDFDMEGAVDTSALAFPARIAAFFQMIAIFFETIFSFGR